MESKIKDIYKALNFEVTKNIGLLDVPCSDEVLPRSNYPRRFYLRNKKNIKKNNKCQNN
jgi:hypothetical protein